ncbi:uncharacterized protein ACIBXB_019781 [Morphnus guianensis]
MAAAPAALPPPVGPAPSPRARGTTGAPRPPVRINTGSGGARRHAPGRSGLGPRKLRAGGSPVPTGRLSDVPLCVIYGNARKRRRLTTGHRRRRARGIPFAEPRPPRRRRTPPFPVLSRGAQGPPPRPAGGLRGGSAPPERVVVPRRRRGARPGSSQPSRSSVAGPASARGSPAASPRPRRRRRRPRPGPAVTPRPITSRAAPAPDLKMQERLLVLLCALARRRRAGGRRAMAGAGAWDGPQRRAWLRHYYSQRQKRLMTLLIARRRRTSCYFYPRAWPSVRSADWWERVVLKEFGPQDWLEKFRMSKETFFYVCNQLRPGLAPHSAHFHPTLPLEKRVAVALWHLATNVEYQTLSPLFGVGPSTVQTCVREVSYAVVLLLKPLYLRLPNEKELENMVRIFRTRWGFPHCIGALDSLHIPIHPPLRLSADYCNGQGWHSILTQATVDGLGQFWDVSTAFPGSMENSAVLESSSLWVLAKEGRLCPNPPKHFMGKAQKYVLLGDATYPLQDWILKPYQEDENLTQRQLQFNYRLKRAHSVIENAFLRLKARWQILLKCDDCSLELLPTLVLACCILHNVCEAHDNPFNEEWLEGTEPTELPKPCQPAPAAMEDGRAEQVRELMCQYFESCGEG